MSNSSDFDSDFSLSDTDIEINDNSTNQIFDKYDVNEYNKLSLKYFPQPYAALGQFIMSSLVGVLITNIMNRQIKSMSDENVSTKNLIEFEIQNEIQNEIQSEIFTNLDKYYSYCASATDDLYLLELLKIIESSEQTDISTKLTKSNVLAKQIIGKLIDSSSDYSMYVNQMSNLNDMNFELINENLVKFIIPLIKFEDLYNIFN